MHFYKLHVLLDALLEGGLNLNLYKNLIQFLAEIFTINLNKFIFYFIFEFTPLS